MDALLTETSQTKLALILVGVSFGRPRTTDCMSVSFHESQNSFVGVGMTSATLATPQFSSW